MYRGSQQQRYGHVSYAQHGDDLFVCALFDGMFGKDFKGNYLDVGAHHPVEISNTALLYDRGWRGVNIEANPLLFPPFEKFRPQDKNLCIGVSGNGGKRPFFMFYPEAGRNSFSQEEVAEAVKNEPQHPIRETKIMETLTLNSILRTHFDHVWPNYLSIDAEGLDYEILESAKFFDDNRPQVICVEVREHEKQKFKELLGRERYYCIARLGENCFFVDTKYVDKVK